VSTIHQQNNNQLSKHWSKASQETNLGPNKLLLNVMFGGLDSKTWAIISPYDIQ
jgi:hypothetical protein